ncbi:hypothetical protein [Acetobacter malorum]|uniref:hypothetical protein n=1 Tax=Acetobacter malorum TaxID=178901 RepID=UPI0007777FA0|nr:hypothetical protein [Acetobacter malorum]KXV05749.1 hypothetical protein AD930_11535 [Acetobacter malorum]
MSDVKFDYCEVKFSPPPDSNLDLSGKHSPDSINVRLTEHSSAALARYVSLMDHRHIDAEASMLEISGLTTGSVLAALPASGIKIELLQKLSLDISHAARSGLLIARLIHDKPKKDFRICLNPRPFGPLIFTCSPRKIDLQAFLGIDPEIPEYEFTLPAEDIISRVAAVPLKSMQEAPRSARQMLVAALDAAFRSTYSTVHGAPALKIDITS